MQFRPLALIRNSSFLASSSIIFAGSFVVNVLNYVFTLLISRLVGVAAFGEVTALFSLLIIVSVPASALTMLMTREAAAQNTRSADAVRNLFLYLRKNVLLGSVIFWVVFLATTPFLAHFLQLELLPLFIFSLLIPVTLASSLQSGTLQGLQEFFMLSKQNVLSACIKLAVSVVLVKLGFSVVGVMLSVVLASLASWTYGYLATTRLLGESSTQLDQTPKDSMQRMFTSILATTLLLTLLSNVDILLAKHFLSPEMAGEYAALSTVGKIVMYGIGAFITVLLPMAAAAHAKGKGGGDRILGLSLAIIAASSLFVCGVFTLFPTQIVGVLFGARYASVAPSLGLFALAMACVSVATALINYFVATENASFIYLLLLGILVEVAIISLHHATLAAMTTSLTASSALLALLMAANYIFARRTPSTI